MSIFYNFLPAKPETTSPSSLSKLTPDEVPSLPLVSHYVYALLSLHVYGIADAPPLPKPWNLHLTAAELGLDKDGYFAASYINEELRHCIIAHRGTADALSLRSGVWYYFNERTILFSLAQQFSKQVRIHLSATKGEGEGEWFISYTGHSLGAVLAACRAVEDRAPAITFESPGCKLFIENTLYQHKADDGDIITYLREPNPINTLRPHCGYIVQLHPIQDDAVAAQAGAAVASKPRLAAIFNAQEAVRGLFQRAAGIPDIQHYLGKIEPLIREMVEHTQQAHSMSSVLRHFKENEEPLAYAVLRWPENALQFMEFYNAKKVLEVRENTQQNLVAAYESLIRTMYVVVEHPKNSLPLRYLSKDALKLLRLWSRESPSKLARMPFTEMDHKVLNTIIIEDGCMRTSVLTAFQAKQYISLIVFKPEIRQVLDRLLLDPLLENASKM
ncbi:hypothetical protein, conserved [Trypanosoma brucei gambiense DAL972]|uniref:Fungal lipase-like domain-containing protein n=2 Tax=Trypanosoma brucei TaxID=5691 RepID=C9ZLD5_TRYB9|nr:hypothetical protein, conserved [Trypanosoma brucei gambiense DAL972]RHW73719.1 hypothetical protein DPX39_030043900 [Trypanosoma brucei equiperdum]CBH10144.1 hypothetical protein, conserved [Trypanosoma brucei gambiense DAL972]|eukprot:XP_011772434.1 hypothetical protein, conserved [Trypanosoma brucei gambiense DAL972]